MSNPRNPTGVVIKGQELDELVSVGREGNCTLILDEFYSWYIYDNDDDAKTPDRGDSKTSSGNAISAASYIRDINAESTVIVDGLTKGFRKPGWRIAWVVGPRELIAALNQCGGYLDGGASHPLQMAAVPLLDPSRTRQDRAALQKHFKHKRDFVISRLNQMGFKQKASSGTFYVWLNLSHLPEPLNSGLVFFEECLREKVIVVPGVFFDVNPSHRRNLMNSPCHHYVRLSFGPPLEQLQRGLEGIEHVINKLKETHPENGTLGKGYIGSDDQSKNSKHLAAISVSGAAI
ncbi:unnamed protein product [Didymodactylos carnosus]|uniref:Aminotransferase class I/classII large domain-containing protein n=2 Tax=Didymodactylos carnosus TaxID=1234261 RepID=A0A8S2D4G1_9BILA|nr:unnamed protein product [Didymodactylos carnosus]CAF3585553.1 unnamed protein product [Didymodactylos carnosus]